MKTIHFKLAALFLIMLWLCPSCSYWDCGEHGQEIEGDCGCVDGYAYPGCETFLKDALGTRLVVDSVLQDGIGKAWGDLTLHYADSKRKPVITSIEEQGFQAVISLDGADDLLGLFKIDGHMNVVTDSNGVQSSCWLTGYLTYDLGLRRAELILNTPPCHITYRMP